VESRAPQATDEPEARGQVTSDAGVYGPTAVCRPLIQGYVPESKIRIPMTVVL
jgi:hypothetical protein